MPPKKRRHPVHPPPKGRGRRETQSKRPHTQTNTEPCPPSPARERDEPNDPHSPSSSDNEHFAFPAINDTGEWSGNKSDQFADFDLCAYTPPRTESCFDPVGKLIPQKMKQKIWEGQYIDFGILLKSTKEMNEYLGGHGEVHVRDGKFCVYQHFPDHQ
jgi:hypothetical protein